MHREIEENYGLAVADINAAFGPGTAPLSVAAAATLYSAIYEQTLCAVTPDFSGSSALVSRLASYGLGEGDWVEVTGLAGRVASSDIRHLPGSG